MAPRKKKEDDLLKIPTFLKRTIGRTKIPVVNYWNDDGRLLKEGDNGKFYDAYTDKVVKWKPVDQTK